MAQALLMETLLCINFSLEGVGKLALISSQNVDIEASMDYYDGIVLLLYGNLCY
jgi:hypothetical protein